MKPVYLMAISFFFSAFGDRLWNFAVGLYLVKLTPGSLQLTAIYGLVVAATAIFISPAIGGWIDRTPRLRAVGLLLVLANLFVLLCALCILAYLKQLTKDTIALKVLQGVIILFGALANLAGVGEKICVSKDWLVVVCKGDRDLLATTNALIRRIDLSVKVLAPICVGFLMSVVSSWAGLLFICIWNIITMFAEYFLLWHVYNNDKDLRHKAAVPSGNEDTTTNNGNEDTTVNKEDESLVEDDVSVHIVQQNTRCGPCKSCFRRLTDVFLGWKIYKQQPVALAGVALALLYLTVLGFSSITNSYASSQGLKEVYISICFGLGALVGISGTFLFQLIQRKIGLVRTGVIGGLMQLLMLQLCVVSIWLPGSPSSLLSSSNENNNNNSLYFPVGGKLMSPRDYNGSHFSNPLSPPNNLGYMSVMMLITGIILSRAGLWTVDLCVTQLQQEYVPESERGTVGGVQYALNNLFDLLHFVATICFPYPRQFWILIFMSVFAVVSSFGTYLAFNFRFRVRILGYEQLE